jgi:hypothetical protein
MSSLEKKRLLPSFWNKSSATGTCVFMGAIKSLQRRKSQQNRWSLHVPSGAFLAGMVGALAYTELGAGSMMPAANISPHFLLVIWISRGDMRRGLVQTVLVEVR